MFLSQRKAVFYACDVLGVPRKKITYCKKTGKGFSNNSFCIVVESNKAYHVRLAKNNFAIDRSFEKSIMEQVGFAFVDFDVKNGNYVRPWLNGTTPKLWNEPLLRSLVSTLKNLHKTVPLTPAPDFDPYLYHHRRKLPEQCAGRYEQLVSKYLGRGFSYLCHNDVHSANLVLQKEKFLVLIDYEWACMNNPFWELGNFVREENLSVTQVGILVNEYGEGITDKELYDFVFMAACYGWLWARCMPISLKIIRQRRKTSKDLALWFKKLSTFY